MLDKNAVGRTTPPMLNEVEKGAIRRFAESLGDYNPIYYDEEYAQASGFPNVVAPPTFVVSFTTGVGPARAARRAAAQPARRRAVASSTSGPSSPATGCSSSSRVAEVNERPSATGKMEVAVLEDEGRDEDGKLVYRARRTSGPRLEGGLR